MQSKGCSWLLAYVTWWSATAGATTMIIGDEQKLAEAADVVVVGKVVETTAKRDPTRYGVRTNARLAVTDVWKGVVAAKTVEVAEMGGELPDLAERYFGVAQYRTGETVAAFLRRRPDGTYQTVGMAMGKFTVVEGGREPLAVRDLGEGTHAMEWDGRSLRETPTRAVFRLRDLRNSVGGIVGRRPVPRAVPLDLEDEEAPQLYSAPFSLMPSPGRWFEADRGQVVGFWTDQSGDATLGLEASRRAVESAMAQWSSVRTASIELMHLGAGDGGALDCSGPSQILFNDPTGSIGDPFFCSGVLALGGYCTGSETMTVNGVQFRRITVGKIVVNDGWGGCPFWTECNLAEVLTHELGHAIGIGHSENSRATMFAYAHFDGRCAAVRADDVAAVSFIYPASSAMHDVVLSAPSPVKATIRSGASESTVAVQVRVRHADTWGEGTRIRLRPEEGTCPQGIVQSISFGGQEPGEQVYVAPGGQATGILSLRVRAEDFTTYDAKAPARCELVLEASTVEEGNLDPFPGNERAVVALDVIDKNDLVSQKAAPVQMSLKPLKPVFLRIPFGKSEQRRKIPVSVRASSQLQTVWVEADPGDCPNGLIQGVVVKRTAAPFSDVTMRANASMVAHLLVRADRLTWTSLFAGSPARCTARLVVGSDQVDADLSNNEVPLVIDVQDDNDL